MRESWGWAKYLTDWILTKMVWFPPRRLTMGSCRAASKWLLDLFCGNWNNLSSLWTRKNLLMQPWDSTKPYHKTKRIWSLNSRRSIATSQIENYRSARLFPRLTFRLFLQKSWTIEADREEKIDLQSRSLRDVVVTPSSWWTASPAKEYHSLTQSQWLLQLKVCWIGTTTVLPTRTRCMAISCKFLLWTSHHPELRII